MFEPDTNTAFIKGGWTLEVNVAVPCVSTTPTVLVPLFICFTCQLLSMCCWSINLPVFWVKLTEPVLISISVPSTILSETNLKSPCVENPFANTLTLWTSPENVFIFFIVIFANDCKITSLAEPVVTGSKSIV